MSKSFAIISASKVVNIALFPDSVIDLIPFTPIGGSVIDISDMLPTPAIGWDYVNGSFIGPIPEPPPASTPQEIFDTALLQGFDTGKGYRLAMQPDDISLFNGLQTLIQSQIISYQLTGNTDGITSFMASSYSIKDINGDMHEDTIQSIFQIIVNYGLYYSQLWQNKQ